jgi:hypothetical protein
MRLESARCREPRTLSRISVEIVSRSLARCSNVSSGDLLMNVLQGYFPVPRLSTKPMGLQTVAYDLSKLLASSCL